MPTLKIQTNAPLTPDAEARVLAACSSRVAELLGKPEHYVMVILEPSAAMLFGGSDAPLAYVELKSLGLPESRTAELSAALCGLLEEQLGVPPGRVYIEFAAPPRHLFGYDGGTF